MKNPVDFRSRSITVSLLVAIALSLGLAAESVLEMNIFKNDQGYSPDQPIAYSHRLHAGELNIACMYCHSGAEKSRNAGIPSLSICMNCHAKVSAPFVEVRAEAALSEKEKRQPRVIVSPEIKKIYNALGVDDQGKPIKGAVTDPVQWSRVHQLPDFVYFDHRPHVKAQVACQTCHGPVETMEKMRQFSDLSMGWCVNCHRRSKVNNPGAVPRNASIDCKTCHY